MEEKTAKDERGGKTLTLKETAAFKEFLWLTNGKGTEDDFYSDKVAETVTQSFNRPLIQKWRKEALEELKQSEIEHSQGIIKSKLTLKETKAFNQFSYLFDDKVSEEQFLHWKFDGEDPTVAETRFYEYLNRYILPQVTIHTQKISSNSHSLVDMFGVVQAFSGTKWNIDSYPENIHPVPNAPKGVDAKTSRILWKNSFDKVITGNSTSAQGLVKTMLKGVKKKVGSVDEMPYRAIIDTGAQFYGVQNEVVARLILRFCPGNIQGVVYFNQENEQMVLERGKEFPVPFADSLLKDLPDQRFTYYDQPHTTGVDITQALSSDAIVTLSKDLTMRDRDQGAYRQRLLHRRQRIHFFSLHETEQAIRDTLKLPSATPINFEHIQRFNFLVQLKQQEAHLIDSIKQKMNHRLKQLTIEQLTKLDPKKYLSDKKDPKVLAHLPKDLELLLTVKTEDSPFANYGHREQMLDKEEVIGSMQNQVLQKVRALEPTSFLFTEKDKETFVADLENDLKKIAEGKKLPNKLSSHLVSGEIENLQVEQEQEQEQEIEKEAEQEVEMHQESEQADRHYLPWLFEESTRPEIFAKETFAVSGNFVVPKGGNRRPGIFRLKEVMQQDGNRSLREFNDLFDKELTATENFLGGGEGKIKTFGDLQFPPRFLLIKDKTTGELQVMLLDNKTDLGFFFNDLEKVRKDQGYRPGKSQLPGSPDFVHCIYDLASGVIQNGSEPWTDEDLLKDKKFQRLLVQVKVLHGVVNYTDNELAILKEWAEEVGVERVKEFFEEFVLPRYRDQISLYRKGRLRPILQVETKADPIGQKVKAMTKAWGDLSEG